ncbi:glycerophosphodiester phosphodiesterase [Metabacillus litoralis]|uniref:glycerophosphodiester phosphodiesterase n=1 Tax=Metabacillus TaxID=2675233 RepID=UPI001E39E668|nr:glycerophosphodiester phosphodiesterase family protein [Metabacillus litoralis]MCM3163892.1 glycerophosphodiester phosphodiesterase [Metabacillus litoralis]MCM3410595.1 glycerophosphodiester phosphodiesterase [Metabacillus litoralis]UHA62602.1 glycerophosphodiester phosphodiesterase [Metabacillus litoralis]
MVRKFKESFLFSKRKHHDIKGNFKVVAHRGASGHAPENTMVAFNRAVELEADYIELDIQMTKDGKLVVIHDPTVDRTTNGTGEVKEFTYEELRKLDAGSWYHKKFSGEKVPSLEEVLLTFKGKIGLLIEVKNPDLYDDLHMKLAEELYVYKKDMFKSEEVIVQSFDFEWLEKFHTKLAQVPLGLLVKYRVQGVSNVQLKDWSSLVQFINPNKALVTKRLVKKIHSYNMRTMPYTVRDKKTIKPLLDAKVDGIITDYPDFFMSNER